MVFVEHPLALPKSAKYSVYFIQSKTEGCLFSLCETGFFLKVFTSQTQVSRKAPATPYLVMQYHFSCPMAPYFSKVLNIFRFWKKYFPIDMNVLQP